MNEPFTMADDIHRLAGRMSPDDKRMAARLEYQGCTGLAMGQEFDDIEKSMQDLKDKLIGDKL